jgi:flagellar hook-associated protein 3 FlgL
MRVTPGMAYQNLLRNLARGEEKLQKSQDQLSSGKKISAPSDDPSLAVDIVRLTGEKVESAQYQRNLQFAQSKLNVTDTVLDSLQTMVERVVTLGERAISNPTAGTQGAVEVDSLRDQIISIGNTTHLGRYIFGGSITTSPPFVKAANSTVSYQGNNTPMTVQVGRSVTLETQIPGNEIFMGSVDIFSTLTDLATAMKNGDNNEIDANVRKAQQFVDSVSTARTRIAGFVNMAANVASELSARDLARAKNLEQEQDANIAQVISELTMNQTSLQATMAAGARIAQLSLLDYLR